MTRTRARLMLALALLTFQAGTWAQQAPPRPFEVCASELPYGAPSARKQRTYQICRSAYAVEYDPQAKVPIWTAYILTPARAVGCGVREGNFAVDESLPLEDIVSPRRYAKSGYDIGGHLVNSSDMRWNVQAQHESFIMTNMAPQLPAFNRGIWKMLEDSTRDWTLSRGHTLVVYSGSIYSEQDSKMNSVTVPHAFFKVIVDMQTSEVQAYIMKHEGSKQPLTSFETSVAEVQRQAGVIIPLPKKAVETDSWKREVKTNRAAKAVACALKP